MDNVLGCVMVLIIGHVGMIGIMYGYTYQCIVIHNLIQVYPAPCLLQSAISSSLELGYTGA